MRRLAFAGVMCALGFAASACGAATPEEFGPPVRSVANALRVECSKSGNGTKWGSLTVAEKSYVFGTPGRPWTVVPNAGLSGAGEQMIIWDVKVRTGTTDDLKKLPNYVVTLGDYRFHPNIAQHNADPSDPMALVKGRFYDDARRKAYDAGETACFIDSCYPSDADNNAFYTALEKVAAEGGDLVITGPGKDGAVELRYSLKGLGDVRERMRACLA